MQYIGFQKCVVFFVPMTSFLFDIVTANTASNITIFFSSVLSDLFYQYSSALLHAFINPLGCFFNAAFVMAYLTSHTGVFCPSSRGLDPGQASTTEGEALPEEKLQNCTDDCHIDQEMETSQSVACLLFNAKAS